jgi:hypothetical protein
MIILLIILKIDGEILKFGVYKEAQLVTYLIFKNNTLYGLIALKVFLKDGIGFDKGHLI